MPKIDIRKTFEVSLPSYPESKIILYDSILAGGMERVMDAKTDFERGLIALQELVKDWNLTDEKEEKLEVNLENLRRLPFKDLNFLLNKVGDFFTQATEEIGKSSKR